MEDLVAVARIVKPRGLKGELVSEMLTDFPERFEDLEDVFVLLENGSTRQLKIRDHWFQKGRVILKFEGIDTFEAADELRNCDVCVREDDAVALDDDEYYDWQLAGCRVEMLDGTPVGTVKELMRTGGTELLVVENGPAEHLIPFAGSICPEVDIRNKLIRIDPPDGLLEF